MKFHKLLGLAALVMFLGIGCAKKSSTTTDAGGGGDGGGTSGLTLADLDGVWVSSCHFDSGQNKYTIITTTLTSSGGGFNTVAAAWNFDNTCAGSPNIAEAYNVSGTVTLGDEITNGFYTYTVNITGIGIQNLSIKKPTSTTFIIGDDSGVLINADQVFTRQ